jgi:hypothetical protein
MSVSERPTALARNWYDDHEIEDGDLRLKTRLFTYATDEGLVAGSTTNVVFTLNQPASVVWPIFKDTNLWQNNADHFYSKAAGDCEDGEKYYLEERGQSEDGEQAREWYEVVRILPEYLMVKRQPPVTEGVSPGLPGLGGVSPGFHVFTLNEHGGECLATVTMEHASYAAYDHDTTDEEALAPWREVAPEWTPKWRDSFVPVLKQLVDEAAQDAS